MGDTGFIESEKEKIFITNTKREDGLILHYADKLPEFLTLRFQAVVDANKRNLTANNHSATHLLHKALQDVLGEHVEQKGSLVNDKYLRFDFSHFSKVTEEELADIETRVNAEIRKDIPLNEMRNTPMKKAQELGAKALFGEKYGDLVRVIQFGDSIELCGGIHATSTGKIGLFKLVSESSTAAGIRRIEAITSEAADKYVNDKLKVVEELNALLKAPKDLKLAVEELLQKNSAQAKEIEKLKAAQAGNLKEELKKEITEVNGVNFLAKKVDLDPKGIKTIAFQLKAEMDNLFLVLCNEANGKANITILVSDDLAKAKDSKNRLLYVTPILKKDVHISGLASITIKVASSKPAANLSVWLVSLPWNGEKGAKITDNIITRGWADIQNYKSLTESKPLKPGKFYTLTFDLQPDDQVIKKGQQIGLMIFSSDNQYTLLPQPGTELTVDLKGTSISLPIVGGETSIKKALGN